MVVGGGRTHTIQAHNTFLPNLTWHLLFFPWDTIHSQSSLDFSYSFLVFSSSVHPTICVSQGFPWAPSFSQSPGKSQPLLWLHWPSYSRAYTYKCSQNQNTFSWKADPEISSSSSKTFSSLLLPHLMTDTTMNEASWMGLHSWPVSLPPPSSPLPTSHWGLPVLLAKYLSLHCNGPGSGHHHLVPCPS